MLRNQFKYAISIAALVLLECVFLSPMDTLVLGLTGMCPLLVLMACDPLWPFSIVPEAKKFLCRFVCFRV